MAKTPKGEKREFEVAVATWVDLLGYGSMLESAGWDPTSLGAKQAISRIVDFQTLVTNHSSRYFPTFVMNDGAVAFRDLSPRSSIVTYDFLRRTIRLHASINEHESKLGQPGARAVLAAGFRVRRIVDFTSRLATGEGRRIKERLRAGEIDGNQAVNHALMARHHSDSTLELQHNYAMTKAYLADSSGSKAGLAGPNLFIDMALFSNGVPSWLRVSQPILWSSRGMSATFVAVEALDEPRANRERNLGIRDAFEVASALSSDPAVVQVIRASRIGDLRKSLPREA